MGSIDKLTKRLFNLTKIDKLLGSYKNRPYKYKVYCQGCGIEITTLGGRVTYDSYIYCEPTPSRDLKCLPARKTQDHPTYYSKPRKVQSKIKKGQLVKYGTTLEADVLRSDKFKER